MKTNTELKLFIVVLFMTLIHLYLSTPVNVTYVTSYHELHILSNYTFGHPIRIKFFNCEHTCTVPKSTASIEAPYDGIEGKNEVTSTNYTFCFIKTPKMAKNFICSTAMYASCTVQITTSNTYIALQSNKGSKFHRYDITDCEKDHQCGLADYLPQISKFAIGNHVFNRTENSKKDFADLLSVNIYAKSVNDFNQTWLGVNLNGRFERNLSKVGWFKLDPDNINATLNLLNKKLQLGVSHSDWKLIANGVINANNPKTELLESIEDDKLKLNTTEQYIFLEVNIVELFYDIPATITECNLIEFTPEKIIHHESKNIGLKCVSYNFQVNINTMKNGSKYLTLTADGRVIGDYIQMGKTSWIDRFEVTFPKSDDNSICVEDTKNENIGQICLKYDAVPMTIVNLGSTASLTFEIVFVAVTFLVLILVLTFFCWRKKQNVERQST